MFKAIVILLVSLLSAACTQGTDSQEIQAAAPIESVADSIADPIERHRASTRRLRDEKSLYQKYRVASDNAAFFGSKNLPVEFGRNLEFIGDVMAQTGDTALARQYYDRAADCFRRASATRFIYEIEMHRSNVVTNGEQIDIFLRMLADTVVTSDPDLHAMALKGAYLATDSLPFLDSCLALLDRNPSIRADERPTLLAMRAAEALNAGDIHDALNRVSRVKAETDSLRPIAQHREYIHTIIAQIYAAAGMKDSSITELCKVIWWTDSAYREANLPAIYARETRHIIDLTENNARLEKRGIILWWAVSVLILMTLAAWILFWAKRRQAAARQEISLLDSRMEILMRSQTAQAAVMEENHNLIDEIENAIGKNSSSAANLATDLRRIISRYSSREENRQGFLSVSRQIDPRFTARLKADFPNLSEGQLRLAALIAAGVDSSQLASILNISSKSLYTSRYRLRTSLRLSKTDSLEALLRSYATPAN